MQQTPIHDDYNPNLLEFIPPGMSRIVEIGCSSGALARAYLASNPDCDYIGVEIVPAYAEVAAGRCTKVLTGNVESFGDQDYIGFGNVDCWVFGDVLEHLYDPWRILRDIRRHARPNTQVIACIPNMQHWSFQAKLCVGEFRYEESGLYDRTHIRWFTLKSLQHLFQSSGFTITDCRGRIFPEPQRETVLPHIRALAQALGANPDIAARDAMPLQYMVRAVVAG